MVPAEEPDPVVVVGAGAEVGAVVFGVAVVFGGVLVGEAVV